MNLIKTTFLIVLLVVRVEVSSGGESTNEIPNEVEPYDQANPKMIWGETTNIMVGDAYVSGIISKLKLIPAALRAGIGVPNSNGVIIISLHKRVTRPADRGYELVSSISNKLIMAYLPKNGERFVLTMTDTNGVTVPKTPEGWTIGKPDSLKPNTRGFPSDSYIYSFMRPGEGFRSQPLDPAEYFVLEKPGLYKLIFVQRMYVLDTIGRLVAITLPPVSVDVRVEN